MIDILLVSLPIQRFTQRHNNRKNDFYPSLGLMSIAAFLELNGRIPYLMDLYYQDISKEDFITFIDKGAPKIIGISAYTQNISLAVSFSKVIKKNFPDTKIIVGGPHVTLSQKEFYDNPEIDFIVMGEGEATILELMEAILSEEKLIKYEDIPGIAFRRNDKVQMNSNRTFIKDLDLLPIPKREYFDAELYKNNGHLIISTSRGCPSKCIYCSASALSGARYRVRSVKNVYLELIMLNYIYGTKEFDFIDDSFTVIKDRVNEFIDMMLKYNPPFYWCCESIANHMNEELLDRLAQSKCVRIQYGIESGSPEVLKKIYKPINLEHAKKIVKLTVEKGILPITSLMIGHYCDTEESVQETINLIQELSELNDIEIPVGYNTPFPGTEQYEKRDELGIRMVVEDYRNYDLFTPVIETDNFTIDDQIRWMTKIKEICFKKQRISAYIQYYKGELVKDE